MQVQHKKIAVALAWVLACGVVAWLVNVSSTTGWIELVGAAVVPPFVLFRMWRPPAQTMSESIHEVLK